MIRLGKRLCAVATVCICVGGSGLQAQDQAGLPPADQGRMVAQLTFSPAKKANVRLTSGVSRSGDLISVSAEKIVMKFGKNEVDIKVSTVRTLRTADGEFLYVPADETYDELLRRRTRIAGATVEMVQVFDDGPAGADPTVPKGTVDLPAVATPSAHQAAAPPVRNDEGVVEFVPAFPTTPRNTHAIPATTAVAAAAPAGAASGESQAAAGDVALCAKCGKEVPATLKDGDTCPHCGVIIWNRPAPASVPVATTNPGGARASAPGGPAPVALPGQAQQRTSTTATVTEAPFSFTTMPMWMKVGLFGGMLAIAWVLMQRR